MKRCHVKQLHVTTET